MDIPPASARPQGPHPAGFRPAKRFRRKRRPRPELRARQTGRFHDLLPGGTGLAVSDVIRHRTAEQVHVLLDDADVLPQALDGHLADVLPVNEDAAAGHIIKAGNQLAEGGFSPAGRPDNRGHTALRNGKADILQNRIAVLIGEGYMLESNIKGVQGDVFAAIVDFFRLLDMLHTVEGGVHRPNHSRHLPHDLNGVENGKGSD
mgnify:CR=1 FL=1